MWNQQRHARDAMYAWSFLQFQLIKNFGWWLLVPFIFWLGYVNHWFTWFGQSPQANLPAKSSHDYFKRGTERIKSPFTWESGVEDLKAYIQMESTKNTYMSKFMMIPVYVQLGKAYGMYGKKSDAVYYLNESLNVAQEAKALASSDVQLKGAKASAQMVASFSQRCVATNCKDMWTR